MSTSTWSGPGRTLEIWADMGPGRLTALIDRNEIAVVGTGVVRGGPDDLAVLALLDHVSGPAGRARDDEQRREHLRRHAQPVVGDAGGSVEIRAQSRPV